MVVIITKREKKKWNALVYCVVMTPPFIDILFYLFMHHSKRTREQ